MVLDEVSLPNRDFAFLQDRLKWLDQEITRYRDFEWRATSFHAAFFVAVIYMLTDEHRARYAIEHQYLLSVAIAVYLGFACWQLVYIHWRLNVRRNDRGDVLRRLGEPADQKITCIGGLWEGRGAIFPTGFLLSLVFLGSTALMLLVGSCLALTLILSLLVVSSLVALALRSGLT